MRQSVANRIPAVMRKESAPKVVLERIFSDLWLMAADATANPIH